RGVIVHDQHSWGADKPAGVRRRRLRQFARRWRQLWKEQGQRAATTRDRLDTDRAVVLPDDAVDRGQTETHAVGSARRKERLKRLALDVRGHPLAVVRDPERDPGSGPGNRWRDDARRQLLDQAGGN